MLSLRKTLTISTSCGPYSVLTQDTSLLLGNCSSTTDTQFNWQVIAQNEPSSKQPKGIWYSSHNETIMALADQN